MKRLVHFSICCALTFLGVQSLTAQPSAEIGNGKIKAKIYLPDKKDGFYRSTRFDWSGVIGSLIYDGHDFYGPWFSKIDPAVYDFNYDDSGVVSAPFTAMVGPGEEFNTAGAALGFADAKPGETFVKIGVGVLRKPDDSRYDHSKTYEVVDYGSWAVKKQKDSVEFTHTLTDPASGYGYIYTKVIRMAKGEPGLTIEHNLKNTGKKTIESTVYNHNFLVLDKQAPGPDLTITFPFTPTTGRPLNKDMAEIRGNQLAYVKTLTDKDRVAAGIRGFGSSVSDYDIRVENAKVGAGYEVKGDHPLTQVALWSIRTVMAIEPYNSMTIAPGDEFHWTLTYHYYTLPANAK